MKHSIFALAATVCASPAFADTPPAPSAAPITINYERVCSDIALTLYFGKDSADLSAQSRAALEAVAGQLEDCAITSLKTDAVSADARDTHTLLALSEARSDNVLEAFSAAGIWASDVETNIILARDPHRTDAASQPLARRVEIQLTTVNPITS